MWPLKNPLKTAQSAGNDPDVILMLQFKGGDEKSFEILFNRHFKYVFNVARRFFDREGPAEEMAQEVFMQVYLVKETYEPKARFKTWIHRITVNKCLNEIRKGVYRHPSESMDARTEDGEGKPFNRELRDWEGKTALEKMENSELETIYGKALLELTEQQRVCFILSRYGSLSYQEIARTVNSTESAVKSLIHRANSSLKDAMKSYLQET